MKMLARGLTFPTGIFLWLAGCATIVGIEDNKLDGGTIAASEACQKYCTKVDEACRTPNAVYSSTEACHGVCKALPPGEDIEPIGNTVACRNKQAQNAIVTNEPAAHCKAAGPGGAPACGDNCTSWCTLMQQICPTEYSAMPDCPRACAALRDKGTFDLDSDHDGDTIQCRLEHVSNAASSPTAAATHCKHAALVASEYCRAPQEEAPDCTEFCRFNMAACKGDLAVYESNKQCLAVCMALDRGFNKDREENTIGCRSWHTFNSLIDPASHCAHTAPGGDGHCGLDTADKTGNCESYCLLAEKACSAGFATQYGSQAACLADCATQPGAKQDSKYRLATAQTGNTVQCRLLHASRALSDATECPSALGQDACQ